MLILSCSVAKVAPAKYREQLIPDFAFAAKRPIHDVNYLETRKSLSDSAPCYSEQPLTTFCTVHRDNVELYCESPQALDVDHVIRKDGQKVFADVVIAATGRYKCQL